jgi:hypothetical protein
MKAILAKPILGRKTLSIKPILLKYAKETVTEFEKTTETWNDTDPTFEYELESDGVLIGPADDEDGQIWVYLEEGTDVRRALMSEDFEAKTTPGVVGSRAGVGGVVYISPDLELPGIEARGWSKAVGDDLEPKFVADINAYLKRTLRVM